MAWKNEQTKDEVVNLCKDIDVEYEENEKESYVYIPTCKIGDNKASVMVNINKESYKLNIHWYVDLYTDKQRLNLLELNNQINAEQIHRVYFEDAKLYGDNAIAVCIRSRKISEFTIDLMFLSQFAERYARAVKQVLLGEDWKTVYEIMKFI